MAVADAARLRVKAFSVDGFERVRAVVDFLKKALKRDHVVSISHAHLPKGCDLF